MNHTDKKSTLGVDISKDKLDIWDLEGGNHRVIANQSRAIGGYFKPLLKKGKEIRVLLEPTGGYENTLIKQVMGYGVKVFMIHPNRLVHYAKSKGWEAKTDKLASKHLAFYLSEQPEDSLKLLPNDYGKSKELQELSSRRCQLKEMIQAEKNRQGHDFYAKQVNHSHKRLIKHLEAELAEIDKIIEKKIEEQETFKHRFKLLQSFKGVGRITAEALILDMPELGQLTREEIAKLMGVAPLNRDSGQKNGYRHIYGGRGHVRKILYMAAMVAIRYNEPMRRFFERLMAKGKAFKVALVAVMRKIICCLNSMVKRNMTWQTLIGLTVQSA